MFIQIDGASGPEWINLMRVRRVRPNSADTNGAEPRCVLVLDGGEEIHVKQGAAETAAHMTGSLVGLLAALGHPIAQMLRETLKEAADGADVKTAHGA